METTKFDLENDNKFISAVALSKHYNSNHTVLNALNIRIQKGDM